MAVLQAAIILVPMVSAKYVWWLKFQQKLPIGTTRLKEKKKGEMWQIYQSLDELSMNYPVVNISDTSIWYVTVR